MDEQLMTTVEVAEFLQVRVNTIEHWRAQGRGPRFVRAGRQVRYRRSEVERWLEAEGGE